MQFRIILPNLNYENEIVSRLIEHGEQDRVQDGVQDRVQENNKAINLITDDTIFIFKNEENSIVTKKM